MDHTTFVSDLSKEIGDFNTVNSQNRRYETYEFESIEGEKFITGKGIPEFLLTDTDLELREFNLLTSLLNLVKGPLPPTYHYPDPMRNLLETVISDDDIFLWVKEYGIPYRDKELNKLLNDEVWRFQYLHANWFRFRVATLYARFSIWKALVEDEPQKINKYDMSLWKLRWNKKYDDNLDDLQVIKKSLAQDVESAARITLGLRYDKETDQNVFTLSTDSLLSVAYYQLSSLMTKPVEEGKKKLKTCDYCNSLFWADNARKKYCPKCNRKTVWSRRKNS